jgi:hypothetical protein
MKTLVEVVLQKSNDMVASLLMPEALGLSPPAYLSAMGRLSSLAPKDLKLELEASVDSAVQRVNAVLSGAVTDRSFAINAANSAKASMRSVETARKNALESIEQVLRVKQQISSEALSVSIGVDGLKDNVKAKVADMKATAMSSARTAVSQSLESMQSIQGAGGVLF